MMRSIRFRSNTMIKSLQLLKNGFPGSISPSSRGRLSSPESKSQQSELKRHVTSLLTQLLSEVTDAPPPLKKLALSIISQALDGVDDLELLRFMAAARDEISAIIERYAVEETGQCG